MNSLWINRMHYYLTLEIANISTANILNHKINQQNKLLRKYHRPTNNIMIKPTEEKNIILLAEARAARHFWRQIGILLSKEKFIGRKPHHSDTVNRLLDIGYHTLIYKIQAITNRLNISPELGLFHKAHKVMSKPLLYDLIELFRTDVVDTEVVKFLKLKKKPIASIDEKDIAYFVCHLNERLEKKFYLKSFKQCHTYKYYMELQILAFIKAVNHKEIFTPLTLPSRHDNRCI